MKSRGIVKEKDYTVFELSLTEDSKKQVKLPLYNGLSIERNQNKGRLSIKYPNTQQADELEKLFKTTPSKPIKSSDLLAELDKKPDIGKKPEKVDKSRSLPKPSYPRSQPTHYKPKKPSEESSVKEIEERLRHHGILPTSKKEKGEHPLPVLETPKLYGCPECNSENIIRDYENSDVVCGDCGLVLDENIVTKKPEWRAFTKEQREKRRRVGAPMTYTIHDKGLSTIIDRRNRDAYGNRIPSGQMAQMYRLRKWHRRIRVSNATERNLAFALSEISKISNKSKLPRNIMETASVIYRKAVKEGLIRGRSIQGVTAAAVYIACRQGKLSRTLDEIAKATNMTKKEVARSYRFLIKKFDYYDIPPQKAKRFINRFSSQLTMQGKVEEIAYKTLKAAKKARLTSGRGPMGMAASASYIAAVLSGERRTQRELAETAGVTEVTIRNRYKELLEKLTFQISL